MQTFQGSFGGRQASVLARSTDVFVTEKRGGFELAAFSDANWGNNPDNGKSASSYVAMLAKGPIRSKVATQGLTDQSRMEAEFVSAALTMKEDAFSKSMMDELGFNEGGGRLCIERRINSLRLADN